MDSVANLNDRSPKRLVRCGASSDIISTLPANIQDNILIRLPVQDAAKTCILSKKWRSKWHYIPELVFDNENFFRGKFNKSPKEISDQLYQVLLLHRGSLRKFVFSVGYGVEIQSSFIDQLILFLTGKDIQEFTLCAPWKIQYRMPSTLFQCIHLTHLDISACDFRVPPEFTGFSRLVNVKLQLSLLAANDFKNFISKCPLVQLLRLQICSSFQVFEIDAPNLKFLYLSANLSSILFKKVPLLSTVIIDRYYHHRVPPQNGKTANIVTVFGSLQAIEYFCCCRDFLISLSPGVLPKRLSSMLNHLKSIELSGLCFNILKEVQCTLLLIKSSPNLQKLKIKVYVPDNYIDDTATLQRLYESQSQVPDYSNKLQEVAMEAFNGTVAELEFLKFVLVKSSVLESITIQPPEGISSDIGLEILMAVTRLKRASPNAEVIFLVGD